MIARARVCPDGTLDLTWAGDPRAYRIGRDGTVASLTCDHDLIL